MSQDFTEIQVCTPITKTILRDNFEALATWFAGATPPTSPYVGQPFLNTSTDPWVLSIYQGPVDGWVDVTVITIDANALATYIASLANSSDITKGAAMVGYDGGTVRDGFTKVYSDLADDTDPAKGAALVGYNGMTLDQALLKIYSDLAEQADPLLGANLVGYSGQSLAYWLSKLPSPLMYGADLTGAVDSLSAFELCRDTHQFFLIPYGTYSLSAPFILTSNFQHIYSCNATLKPTFDGPCVSVWAPTATLIRDVKIMGMLYVEWDTADWSENRIAYDIQNSFHGEFHVSAKNATRTVHLHADTHGCVYNDFYFGTVNMSNVSVYIDFTGGGYVNANNFYGGRFNGTGDPTGSLFATVAGHIYITGGNVGNSFISNSLEWIGTGSSDFKACRCEGEQNRFAFKYVELRDTLYVWAVDDGISNYWDCNIPYLSGYNPDDPTNSRLDASGAVNPNIDTNLFGYEFVNGGPKIFRSSSTTYSPVKLINDNTGPSLTLQNTSTNTSDVLVIKLTNGNDGVTISPGGTYWQVKANTAGTIKKRVIWDATAAPSTGTWTRGDIAFNTSPSAGGTAGWICVTGGTPGTWKTFGTIAS